MTDTDKTALNEHWIAAQDSPKIEFPQCDVEKYKKHLEDYDLSDEEKKELLKTLWMIMAAFVDLGFGVDSIQILHDEDEQDNPINSKGVSYDD